MKEFLGKDFLLNSEVAKDLYFDHAAKMPIFDFHCHLSPKEIAEDHKFSSLTEVWLGGDHYKWRLLREFGVDESYITGNKSDEEKFLKYAEVLPYMVGNPVYQWTHLELRTFFGINDLISPKTAKKIYEECNKQLETMTARKMMEKCNVAKLFTTDDPVDDLHYHMVMAHDKTLKADVKPCWRPDKAINIERASFLPWIRELEKVTEKKAIDLESMLRLLDDRLEFFLANGLAATDHALDEVLFRRGVSYEEANEVYKKALNGEPIGKCEEEAYKSYLLLHLGRLYHSTNLVMQLHIGALRNNSSRQLKALGVDTGFDGMDDARYIQKLSAFLDELDKTDELPKTVLYCLNPADHEALMVLANCFQDGKVKGKVQLGAAWWFNDHFVGMGKQLDALSSDGLLACFIGMLTDSRSFLSYTRHDYFRREFCDYLGRLVEEGKYPDDRELLGQIVEDVCYNNAINYFKR